MKDFFELMDRNVQDITYDIFGLIFPGLITLMYIYFSKSISVLGIKENIFMDRFHVLNNMSKMIIIFLLAYLIGLIFHGVYANLFKVYEKQSEKEECKTMKYFDLCKDESIKNLIKYDGIIGSGEKKFGQQAITALHILQRKSKNKYLSKYLAKRVMYRNLMILCSLMAITNFTVELYMYFVKNQLGYSVVEMLLNVFLVYLFKSQIQSYTRRILKEIRLGIALL